MLNPDECDHCGTALGSEDDPLGMEVQSFSLVAWNPSNKGNVFLGVYCSVAHMVADQTEPKRSPHD